MEHFPTLLVAIAMIPVAGFGGVWLIQRMVGGELGLLPGLAGILTLVLLVAIAVLVPEQRMAGPVVIVLVAMMAFFPFAESQLEKHELAGIDHSRIDRAHRELSLRPENLPARFELARAVYDQGLYGHAIAIAENTLAGLSTDRDLVSMQSLRDKFRAEDYEVKKWRRELSDPRAFDPVQCPSCGQLNPPGNIACEKCKGPYLLELARVKGSAKPVYGRLTAGFALTALLVVLCSWAGMTLEWPLSAVGVGGAIAAIGALMGWIYRPRTLRD